MASNLSPTAQAILQALTDGPATAAHLRTTTGRSKSTIDKTLNDLVTNELITARDGDTDDQPRQYSLASAATDPDTSPSPDVDSTPVSNPDTDPGTDAGTDAGTEASQQNADEEELVGADDRGDAATIGHEQEAATAQLPVEDDPQDGNSTDPGDAPDGGEAITGDDAAPAEGPDTEDVEGTSTGTEGDEKEVKNCRGCQTTMPLVCPCCGRRTLAYCVNCQTVRPAARRREPGKPEILANGLPKLRGGELAKMVHQVMSEHPVPDYRGVVGWTSSRISVFLPGRSTGAIGESLEKLAGTGQAEFLGDNPRRYVLTPPEPASDTSNGTGTGTESGSGSEMTSDPDASSESSPQGVSSDGPDDPIS